MLSLPRRFVWYPLVQRENSGGQLRVQLPWNYLGAEGDADAVGHRLLGAAHPTRQGLPLQNTIQIAICRAEKTKKRTPATGQAVPTSQSTFFTSQCPQGCWSFFPHREPPLTCGPLAGNLGRICFVRWPPAALFFPSLPTPFSLL